VRCGARQGSLSPNLRSQRLNKLFRYVLRNNGVTFWLEGDRGLWDSSHAYGVPSVPDCAPSPRCKCQACGQNGMVRAGMALLRRHIADANVLVLHVLPMHKCGTPFARSLQRNETLGGALLAVRGGAKQ
jgi:hypothetical protein